MTLAALNSPAPENSQSLLLQRLSEQAAGAPGAASLQREIRSLHGEADPQLLSQALFSLAQRLENSSREGLALQIYGELSRGADGVSARAARRLAALQGGGDFGAQAEVLARRVLHEVSSPEALPIYVGMGTAMLTFRVARLATLSRLTLSSGNLLTRGAGASLLSGGVGFLSEGAAFTAAVRGTRLVLGQNQEWTASALGRELSSSYLGLGAIRAGGSLSQRLSSALGAESGLARGLLTQGGQLGGIYLGHSLEHAAGLTDRRLSFAQALSTLFQYNVMGSVTRRALGPRFHALELRLESQTRSLESASQPPLSGGPDILSWPGLQPAFATASAAPVERAPSTPRWEGPQRPEVLQMAANSDRMGPGAYSREGLEIARRSRAIVIPDGTNKAQAEGIVKDWIETQTEAIAVARMEASLNLARFVLCNRAFTEKFGWMQSELVGRPVREFFPEVSVAWMASRIGLMNVSGEFDSSRIAWLTRDGQHVNVIGSGVVRKFGQAGMMGVGVFMNLDGSPNVPATPVSAVQVRGAETLRPAGEGQGSTPSAVRPRATSRHEEGGGLSDRVRRILKGEDPES